jgi:hypothetical protein
MHVNSTLSFGLGIITTNASDAIEATTKAHTILWPQALDGAHPLTFATIIGQEHESPDKPDFFEAPPGAEPWVTRSGMNIPLAQQPVHHVSSRGYDKRPARPLRHGCAGVTRPSSSRT